MTIFKYTIILGLCLNSLKADIISDSLPNDPILEKENKFSIKEKEDLNAHLFFAKALLFRGKEVNPTVFFNELFNALKKDPNSTYLLKYLVSNSRFIPTSKFIKNVSTIAKNNPKAIFLNFFIAGLLLEKEKHKEAMQFFNNISKYITPSHRMYSTFVSNISSLYIKFNEIKKGELLFLKIEKQNSKDFALLISAVSFYQFAKYSDDKNKKKYEKMENVFLDKIQNTYSTQYHTIKELYPILAYFTRNKQPKKNIEIILNNLSFKPDDEHSKIYLAQLYYDANEFNQSFLLWKKILKNAEKNNLKIDLVSYHLSLGEAAQRCSRLKEAKKAFKYCIMMNEKNLDAKYRLATIYYDERNYDEAITLLKEIKTPYSNYLIALALQQQEKIDEAVKVMEKTEKQALKYKMKHFLNIQFYMNYAYLLDRINKIQEAERCLSIILKDNENEEEALNFLGYMWADNNIKLDKAETLIRKALKKQPKNVAFLDSLAWVMYRTKRYNKALEQINKIIKIDKSIKNAEIADHAGDIYLKLDDKVNAIKYWKIAIEDDSEYIDKTVVENKIKSIKNIND